MDIVERPLIEQTFFNVSVSVPATGVPIAPLDVTSMIQTILLCNPSTNTNSIFFGDINVTTATGIELLAGTSVQLMIDQERQLYEIQDPDLISAQIALCGKISPIGIPVICWKPQNLFLIAPVAGPTIVSAMFFRNVYT
jgi:hypothetical protein